MHPIAGHICGIIDRIAGKITARSTHTKVLLIGTITAHRPSATGALAPMACDIAAIPANAAHAAIGAIEAYNAHIIHLSALQA